MRINNIEFSDDDFKYHYLCFDCSFHDTCQYSYQYPSCPHRLMPEVKSLIDDLGLVPNDEPFRYFYSGLNPNHDVQSVLLTVDTSKCPNLQALYFMEYEHSNTLF